MKQPETQETNPERPAALAGAPGSAWRNPETDPPTSTGKILVWVRGVGPAIVNVEERWMAYWDGSDETEMADPDEWDAWANINKPKERPTSGDGERWTPADMTDELRAVACM